MFRWSVSAPDDQGEALQGGVREPVLVEDRLKSTFVSLVAKLDVGDVVGDRALSLGYGENLVGRNLQELRFRVHKSA